MMPSSRKCRGGRLPLLILAAALLWAAGAAAQASRDIFPVGELPPTASTTSLRPGDRAPEFALPSIAGPVVSLAQYRGQKNVVISFVPAAWTPVCSRQWPMYHDARETFEAHDAVVLGITVDNIPSLYAWTRQVCQAPDGVWFPVLSDFFPHGEVARRYGVLRSDGVSERALFVVDKQGILRHVEVMDINRLPHFERLARVLEGLD